MPLVRHTLARPHDPTTRFSPRGRCNRLFRGAGRSASRLAGHAALDDRGTDRCTAGRLAEYLGADWPRHRHERVGDWWWRVALGADRHRPLWRGDALAGDA